MLFSSFVDSLVKRRARSDSKQPAEDRRRFRAVPAARFFVQTCVAGLQANFDGALHAGPIAWIEFHRAFRIEPAQHFMKVYRRRDVHAAR